MCCHCCLACAASLMCSLRILHCHSPGRVSRPMAVHRCRLAKNQLSCILCLTATCPWQLLTALSGSAACNLATVCQDGRHMLDERSKPTALLQPTTGKTQQWYSPVYNRMGVPLTTVALPLNTPLLSYGVSGSRAVGSRCQWARSDDTT